ncbi:PREDICTED: uncharacterized protein LOC107171594 [Diuraphis noxia]|uniref:uncharacterized protein LOC107171594 n=1 Tax=Diuraphis noxia TaxID=143948 RepID=UPI0007635CA2|nr:PREDICTED: uncharacterized protein LOC107171594 [Diuraphis noxia]
MKRFISIIWVFICTMAVFQNGGVYAGKCILCKFGSILTTPVNVSVATKSNNDKLKTRHTMTISLQNSILVKTSLDHHHIAENGFSSSINTVEDLVKFCSQTSLAELSPDHKVSLIATITSVYGSMMDPPPPAIVTYLVGMFACTPKLFNTLSQPCLNSALSILSVNRCALCEVPSKDRVLFLNGLLSLSAGALNSIPRGSFISILGIVSSPEFFVDLPHPSAINLITALSMSKPTFNCLPIPTLLSFLTFVSCKSELLVTVSPSTVFGFLDGLLETLDESSPFLVNTIPTPVLVGILSPLMTSRMLSVMPISTFDLLCSVFGSSQALTKGLPVTHFTSMFNVLIPSPKILSSLNPNNFAKMLSTVVTCPSVLDNFPSTLRHQLFDSITVYLPNSLACIPSNDYSLLFGDIN